MTGDGRTIFQATINPTPAPTPFSSAAQKSILYFYFLEGAPLQIQSSPSWAIDYIGEIYKGAKIGNGNSVYSHRIVATYVGFWVLESWDHRNTTWKMTILTSGLS